MMVATVRGSVGGLRGSLEFDPRRPAEGAIEVTADAGTVTTREPDRDRHLHSADFFSVADHPEIRFRSTKVDPDGDGELEIEGELTIRGGTRSVTAQAEIEGLWDDPKFGKRVGFTAKMTIDRREWGLVWNRPIANGGLLVGEKVNVELSLAAVAALEDAKAA